MNLISETGEYYSKANRQVVYYRQRVEGLPVVKATGSWFYNHETDKFISEFKFIKKLEDDELISRLNASI